MATLIAGSHLPGAQSDDATLCGSTGEELASISTPDWHHAGGEMQREPAIAGLPAGPYRIPRSAAPAAWEQEGAAGCPRSVDRRRRTTGRLGTDRTGARQPARRAGCRR